MNTQQALAVLKQVLNAATKEGLFQDMTSAVTAAQAYDVVFNQLQPKEKKKEPTEPQKDATSN